MGEERADYDDDHAGRRRSSPLLTIALVAAFVLLFCLLGWMAFLFVLFNFGMQH